MSSIASVVVVFFAGEIEVVEIGIVGGGGSIRVRVHGSTAVPSPFRRALSVDSAAHKYTKTKKKNVS